MPARSSQWIQSTIAAAPYHRAMRSTLISRTIADMDVYTYTAPQTTHSVVHTHIIVDHQQSLRTISRLKRIVADLNTAG